VQFAHGSQFGPYRVIEPLGKGGMAAVYKAYEAKLDRHVALKVLPAEFLHDDAFAARFQREAKLIAKLEHKDIVPIYDFGIQDRVPWMAMRLVPGGTLSTRLRVQGRLTAIQTVEVLQGVAEALDHAHALGVIHRDLKPQNVLLDERGRVYLADFGIAKMVEGSTVLTRAGFIVGTPQYMAPEQALAQSLDATADIYALGVIAYELLTGRVPFEADTPLAVLMKHVRDPVPVDPLQPFPEALRDVLVRAMAKAPSERWESAGAFVRALAGAGDTTRARAAKPANTSAKVDPRPPVTASVPPTDVHVPRSGPMPADGSVPSLDPTPDEQAVWHEPDGAAAPSIGGARRRSVVLGGLRVVILIAIAVSLVAAGPRYISGFGRHLERLPPRGGLVNGVLDVLEYVTEPSSLALQGILLVLVLSYRWVGRRQRRMEFVEAEAVSEEAIGVLASSYPTAAPPAVREAPAVTPLFAPGSFMVRFGPFLVVIALFAVLRFCPSPY
jgi:serine/threonine protein kinase